jgi:hypothetical protein
MAPDVDKKSTVYSPIRADRWSCGRVLLYLLDELKTDDERLRNRQLCDCDDAGVVYLRSRIRFDLR